jgi:pyochelin synthetase
MPVVFTSAVGLGAVREPAPVPGAGPASGRPPASRDGRPPGSSDGRPPGDPGISQTPQVWIDCQALERAGGLVINWDVRQGVFPDGLVDDMFGAFEELVRELAAGRRWEAADPVPLPERQLARRRAVNATAAPRPAGRLPDRVVQQCRRTPDRPAVLTRTGSLTYRELLARAGALAAAVRAAGGQHRDLVAVLLPTGPEQVVAVLGILLAGCAYLPVDTRAPAARRAAMLADAGVRLAVVSAATPEPLPVPAVRVDQLPGGPAPEPDPAGPADPAYVIYTSGSTGRPKGVVIPHRGALNTVQDITARFGVGPEDRVLGLASLSFDLSVYDIFGPLAVGGALVLPDPDRRGDPSHWAELVGTHQVTVWNSVPVQLQMLADYLRGEPELALPSLRLAMLSGDWIPVGLPDQIRSRLPDLVVHSLGGATEASIWSVGFPIDRVRPEWTSIPYGRPLANQTCQVLDQAMRPCPDWAVGELYLGGAGLADGYLGDPALTAQRFVPDPVTGERLYRTGDLCRYLPTGDLELLGREDRQVKIRGHRIELAEIEAALQAYPSVGGAAVVVEGEGALERRLAGFVEPASRADDPAPELPEAVSAAARAELARIRATQDGARAVGFARQLDRTALLAMVTALRQAGLFGSAQTSHTVPEVLAAAGVAPRHARLIRRWVQALERHGMLVRDPVTGRLRASPSALAVGPATVAAAWRRVDALLPEGGQRPELVDYFRTASQHLPELMRDQLDPVQLLFPQGRPDIQESAYRDNFLSDTLNRVVVAAVRELARRWPAGRPLRVLEVGAGVGGTSSDLIPALAGFPVEYRFTDVSQYFLHLARDRFAAYPWVSYQRFDLNQDYRSQGLTPNRLDLVLCANVLHYARHAGQAVARLRELLGPGGWLVFVETTRDNYQILTSMEFLFDATAGDFEDVRAGRDQTFLSVRQWRELLAGAGARPAVLLTEPDQALDRIGMHVFAARFKPDRVPVELADLRRHLADRLPDYLLPARLEVLDGLPLTGNGKVDRARLDQLLATPAGSAGGAGGGSAEPSGPLEAAVAAVWAGLLPAARVGRDDDLFRLGGDSLVAAQLVGRLREEVPEAAGATFDQLLRELLEGATVASLAATLAGATGPGAAAAGAPGPDVAAPGAAAGAVPAGAGPADSGPPGGRLLPAGPVGPGAGTGPVRLLLPDGTGEPPAVPGWPPAGPPPVRAVLPDPDRFERLDPAVLVQTLAEQYVRELAGRFPARPVALAGQDLGGVLAHEVARQWAEAGHPVRELTVVAATPLPGRPDRPGDLLAGYLFARALGVAAPDLGLPPEPELAGRLEAGDGQVLTPLAAEPEDWRVARIASLIDTDPAELAARYRVFRHGLAALAGHRPLPYAGDLTLVVGFDPGYWPATAAAVEARWRASCLGEFRVVHRIGSRP